MKYGNERLKEVMIVDYTCSGTPGTTCSIIEINEAASQKSLPYNAPISKGSRGTTWRNPDPRLYQNASLVELPIHDAPTSRETHL